MIRKWKWIRAYCKRQGFEKAAEIADQIDRVLCYVYGEVNTDEWEEYMLSGVDGIDRTGEIEKDAWEVKHDIVNDAGYCIACREAGFGGGKYLCSRCAFGRLTGRCDDYGSLFLEFLDRYSEERR
jgi:hypothetical protein